MCKPTKCSTCSGITWWGCGQHIPMVMDAAPTEQWCSCPKPEDSQYPPMGPPPACT
ncbi:hypothetical protein FN846DRAFT_815786 [Sphaerosporella brunnea]|uniref:Uncharacterized protein n=1 Tax=Sphaerosporella brunnea TaxID=1250544 RepID=A0A5J5EPS9_9PEZI|nr:hypothetical protein FN846DRAFT_815786 [Sphaerosporella brunnea]